MTFTEKDIENIHINNNGYSGNNISYTELPLIEFKFYNKKNGFINEKKLNEYEQKTINDNKPQIWSNKFFLDSKLYFKIFYCPNNKKVMIALCELPVKMLVKDFNEIKSIENRCIFFKNEIDNNFKNMLIKGNIKLLYGKEMDKLSYIFNSAEDFIDFMVYKTFGKIMNNYVRYDKQKILDAIEIIFGEKIDEELLNSNRYQRDNTYSQSVDEIIKVREKRILDKNFRIAFCGNHSKYESEYYFLVVPEDNPQYFYIDEGKFFLDTGNNKRYFFDNNIVQKNHEGKYMLELHTYKSIKENINNLLSTEEIVITHNIYRFYKDNSISSGFNSNSLTERQMAIHRRYKQLISQGKDVKIDSVKLSRRNIELDNGQLKLEFPSGFIDIKEKFDEVRGALNVENAGYNYNAIYENLLELSRLNFEQQTHSYYRRRRKYARNKYYKSGDFVGVGFKINDIPIKVYKKNNRIYLNDICIRVSDVKDICSKAICYTDVIQFNKYVKDVSAIGVIWKKMINNGVQIKLLNPFSGKFSILNKDNSNNQNIILRFSLLWDLEKRSKVHLMLNGEKYLINNKVKFKKYFNMPEKVTTIEDLGKELSECIKELDETKMFEIVDNAIEEAKIVRKRGRALVDNTIKDIDAKLVEEDINGNKVFGYKFKGRRSGVLYFINKETLVVYKYVNGKWNSRCVVDDHTKQRIFEDRLANRLVNIYNEPKYIHTLHNI